MSDDSVVIRARLEGASEVAAGLGTIISAVEGLNSGSSNLPDGSPSFVPRAPSPPTPTYAQGHADIGANYPQPSSLNPLAYGTMSTQGYGPSAGTVGPPPGYFAPPPPGTRGRDFTEGYAQEPGQGVQNSHSSLSINAQNVTLRADTVVFHGTINVSGADVDFAGGRGGGAGSSGGSAQSGAPGFGAPAPPGSAAGIGGGGVGGAGTGGGAGAGPGGSGFNFQPEGNPPPSGVPQAGGIGFGPMFQAMWQNPTPGGIYNAITNHMPVGMIGPIAGAAYLGHQALEAAYSGQRPQFETELAQQSAQISGQYISPYIMAGQSAAADLRGRLGFESARAGFLNPLTFGLSGTMFKMDRGQQLEQEIATADASGNTDQQIARLSAITGAKISDLKQQYGSMQPATTHFGFSESYGDDVDRAFASKGVLGGVWEALAHNMFDDNVTPAHYAYDPEKTKYLGVQNTIAGAFQKTGAAMPGYVKNSTQFEAAFGKTMRTYGPQETASSFAMAASGVMDDPSQVGLYAPGTDPTTAISSLARVAASRGQDISGLQPQFFQQGRTHEYNEIAGIRRNILLAHNEEALGQFGVGSAQAHLRELSATGAGFGSINTAIEAQKPFLAQQLRAKQTELSYAATDADRARIGAEIAGIQATVAGMPLQEAQVKYGQLGTSLSARSSGADLGFQQSLYAGADERQLAVGFAARGGAMQWQADLLYEQSQRRDIYDPAQREAFGQQAAQLHFQATTGLAREQASTSMDIAQGRAGVHREQASSLMTNASLFGNASDVREAGREQVNSMKESLKAIEDRIRSGNLSLSELSHLTGEQVSLTRQKIETETATSRRAAQQEVDTERTKFGTASTVQGRSLLLGAGGIDAMAGASALADQSGSIVAAAQRNADLYKNADPNNPSRLKAEADLEFAKMQQSQAIVGLAAVPMPLSLTQSEKRGEFQLSMLSRTYASYGDIRGTVSGLMGNAQKELESLQAMERKAESEGKFAGPEGERLRAEFENRRMEVGNRAIGYQQQLETGWQDRLISSVVNAPGSFGYAASAFTRHEAASFLGGISPAFGFSNAADRDHFMFRGPKVARSLVGNITTPEGFAETAMSGHQNRGQNSPDFFGVPSGHTDDLMMFNPVTGQSEHAHWDADAHSSGDHSQRKVLPGPGQIPGRGMPFPGVTAQAAQIGGTIRVEVTVRNEKGNSLGSTTKVVHDLGAGAGNFISNPHASAAPRF